MKTSVGGAEGQATRVVKAQHAASSTSPPYWGRASRAGMRAACAFLSFVNGADRRAVNYVLKVRPKGSFDHRDLLRHRRTWRIALRQELAKRPASRYSMRPQGGKIRDVLKRNDANPPSSGKANCSHM